MDSPILVWLGLISTVATFFGFRFYARLGLRLRHEGGEVGSEGLGVPDLLVSSVLASMLGMLAIMAFAQTAETPPEITVEQLVAGMILPLTIMGFVLGFMIARKVRIGGVMFPVRISPLRVAGRGALMLLAALPIMGVATLLAQLLPQDLSQQQELVRVFKDVSKAGNLHKVLLIALAAVVVAPLWEEVVFRGYFYPVWKRYFGPEGSAVLASTLFALLHANAASFLPLFALALCLTLAFEASGSIFVPIAMHAIFNATTLVFLYLGAQGVL